MGVIVDMILAVAVVAATTGAVAEFQFRIAQICTAANSTFMGIGCLGLWSRSLIGSGSGEGDDLGLLRSGGILLLAEHPHKLGAPSPGNDIQHILAKEQEVVGKGDHGEEIQREGIHQQAIDHQGQINQRKDPCLDGNDEEQQELRIREHGGIAEEEAQVQVSDVSSSAENHAPDVHHDDAGKIEEIETECTPDIFHGSADGLIAEQGNGHQQQIAIIEGQGIADQSPDLTLQNGSPIKNQQGIENGVLRELRHEINQRAAQTDIHHEVGNALAAMLKAEAVKAPA